MCLCVFVFLRLMNIEIQQTTVCYLAPLQGFTDFVYRRVYSSVFSGIDAFFIPYISVKNSEILKKYEKEVLPENNPQERVIPQILAGSADEVIFLSNYISSQGYTEINLNLGCPYPMVTNRGMGSGLLPYPEKIQQILTAFFENSDLKLSVKMRAGFTSEKDIEQTVPVLNQFPLSEVILHPRVAKQLYSGKIIDQAFEFAAAGLKHQLFYNGDIFSVEDKENVSQKFPETSHFMLGRGVLMNPFLPAEIKGISPNDNVKREKLTEFHMRMFEEYHRVMDNPGNALNKMKQFWSWFSFNFENQKKLNKQIQKAKGISDYKMIVRNL